MLSFPYHKIQKGYPLVFRDRSEAGIKLADRLKKYKGAQDVLVLALPRGGVVTGFEVSRLLGVPLDVLIVRKIGAPRQPELAAAAVSETGVVALNQFVVSAYMISEDYLKHEISRQKEEISRRAKLYRKGKRIANFAGKTVILVDDGVATGATMKAAIETLRKEDIKKLVIALPVAPPDTADELREIADEFVCLEVPSDFGAVGNFYQNFSQVPDEDVVMLLQESQAKGEESSG
jgi:putative phosphoribosyl transferase